MVRVWAPEDLWTNAKSIATASGIDGSKAVLAFLRWYTGEPGAQLPEPATRKEPDRA